MRQSKRFRKKVIRPAETSPIDYIPRNTAARSKRPKSVQPTTEATLEEEKIKFKELQQENKLRRLQFLHKKLQVQLADEDETNQRKIDLQIEKSRKEMEAAVRRQKIKERMERSRRMKEH